MSLTLLVAMILAQPPSESAYLPPNLFLVRAKAVSVAPVQRTEPLPGSVRGTRPAFTIHGTGNLVVAHVYLGPDALKSIEFDCGFRPPQQGSIASAHPILVSFIEKGAHGLWWIHYDAKTKQYRPQLDLMSMTDLHLENFPIQDHPRQWATIGGGPVDAVAKFKPWLAWAVAAEQLHKAASDDDRGRLLLKLAADDQSLAAPWAIALLGRASKPADIAALRRIAEVESYRGVNQPAIDEVLSKADPEGWGKSEARKRTIRRWLDGRADSSLSSSGSPRLTRAYFAKDLDAETLLAAVDDALAGRNGVQQPKNYYAVARLLSERPPRESDRQRFFEQFVKNAEYPHSGDVREAAAIGLRHLHNHKWPSADHYQQVRALRARSTDAKVIAQLDHILGRAQPDKPIPPPQNAPMVPGGPR